MIVIQNVVVTRPSDWTILIHIKSSNWLAKSGHNAPHTKQPIKELMTSYNILLKLSTMMLNNAQLRSNLISTEV